MADKDKKHSKKRQKQRDEGTPDLAASGSASLKDGNASKHKGKSDKHDKHDKRDKRDKHGAKHRDEKQTGTSAKPGAEDTVADVRLDSASVAVPGDLADSARSLPMTPTGDVPPPAESPATAATDRARLDASSAAPSDRVSDMVIDTDTTPAIDGEGVVETGKVAADAASKAARKAAEKAARRDRKAARHLAEHAEHSEQDGESESAQNPAPAEAALLPEVLQDSPGEAANDAAEDAAAAARATAHADSLLVDESIVVLVESVDGSVDAAVIAVHVVYEAVSEDGDSSDDDEDLGDDVADAADDASDAHEAGTDDVVETAEAGPDAASPDTDASRLTEQEMPAPMADAEPTAGSGREDGHLVEYSASYAATSQDPLSDDDIYLFNEGRHHQLYNRLGARRETRAGVEGWRFAVWAPNAEQVSVIGDFNAWDAGSHELVPLRSSGVWSGFVAGAQAGQVYKYAITSRSGEHLQKADPFATRAEVPPLTGSILWETDYVWSDDDWMAQRGARNAADAPMSIYEMHPGSWRHREGEGDRWLTYRELAEPLAEHLTVMGFTHVEFLPLMEHPFYGSWGYQSTGYFAPTSRYGSPQDLMYLIDVLHQRGLGVILDWVPSHFPDDPHGLARFDGTHLYEHADPRQGFHPDWGSMIFNYGRNEVRSFLLSSAMYWLDLFHIDGIRVDAVASMLYLDYSREPGEWIPNQFGGRENLEAVEFLRQLNTDVYGRFPDVQVIAEESTAWPGVSRPVYDGGLGFGMKWDMGWMHDTLQYFSRDPIHRRFHHNELTFRMVYAFDESFVLPFSHDEVVHGKGSMLAKQVGDEWQQFANLRLLYTYMYAQPGKKLLFMGSEFGTRAEWDHESSLDWAESREDVHRGISHLVGDLNRLLRAEPALQRLDFSPSGFTWLESTDGDAGVLAFMRSGGTPNDDLLCVFNLTPVPRYGYRVGAPQDGFWREVFNSDAGTYRGSGVGNLGGVHTEPTPWHGQPHSIPLTLPPLAGVLLRRTGGHE